MNRRNPGHLPLMTLALLLVAASRIFWLDVGSMQPGPDEVWSVWQTLGSLGDVLRWTPYDWPPGYYVALWAWQNLVGLHPIALRMLSVLAMLIAVAGMYRAGRSLLGARAGLLAALAYAAFGYVLFLSIELRGYALLLGVLPLALWQTVRYFAHPGGRRGVLLGLLLAAMFYLSMTGVVAGGMLLLVSLALAGRGVWRWWLPGGLAALLFLPQLVDKLSLAVGRIDALNDVPLEPGLALPGLYAEYMGVGYPLWGLLFGLASLRILWRRRWRSRRGFLLLLWCTIPVLLYLTHSILGFFYARYSWWVMPGLALWVGWGLAMLPKAGAALAGVLLAALLFAPLPLTDYQIRPSGLAQLFAELAQSARWGDVLLVDPNCRCLDAMEADYYRRVYFPNGFDIISSPGGSARIWYLSNWASDPLLNDELTATRLPGKAFGRANAYVQLFEAPPDPVGVVYENGLVFHGVDYPDLNVGAPVHEGETLRIRLWWSAERAIDRDYSAGLYWVTAAGEVVAQSDGPPGGEVSGGTSQWTPGQLYVEERTLQTPFPATPISYRQRLAVYDWQTLARADAPGLNAERLLDLGRVRVVSW